MSKEQSLYSLAFLCWPCSSGSFSVREAKVNSSSKEIPDSLLKLYFIFVIKPTWSDIRWSYDRLKCKTICVVENELTNTPSSMWHGGGSIMLWGYFTAKVGQSTGIWRLSPIFFTYFCWKYFFFTFYQHFFWSEVILFLRSPARVLIWIPWGILEFCRELKIRVMARRNLKFKDLEVVAKDEL